MIIEIDLLEIIECDHMPFSGIQKGVCVCVCVYACIVSIHIKHLFSFSSAPTHSCIIVSEFSEGPFFVLEVNQFP